MPVVEFPPTSGASATAPSPATPTAEPTAGPIELWASPGLPPELLQLAGQLTEVDGRPVAWADDGSSADVRLEPNPKQPLSRWVYALVAPFPTLTDEMTLADLQQIWNGGVDRPIYLAGEAGVALSSVLGPGSNNLKLNPQGDLLDLVWASQGGLAIVPFEQLEPRWKVLAVGGQSPIHNDFLIEQYPLAVSFGLSGDSSLFEPLSQALNWPASNRDPNKLTILLMTGVTALVRGTEYRMQLYTPEYPALRIEDWLRSADLTHVSNEVSFYENCPPPDPFAASLRFCSSIGSMTLLERTGIDLIELTGNHLLDYGPEPFLYTLARYRDLGIQTFGGGGDLESSLEPAIVEHHGNRLALLGCNAAGPTGDWASATAPGSTPCSDQRVLERVSELRDQGYQVIFTFQWPESDSPLPLPNQVEAFRQAVEAGAVIVNGSQAHRPQTMEFYQGAFIHYGLGNLFFDQMQTLGNRQEFLDRQVFYDGHHISIELLTALLEDYAQPQPMAPADREALLSQMFELSGW